MTTHIQFVFLTRSVSAYDAAAMFADGPRQRRQYQLAKAASGDPNHEIEFGWGHWEDEIVEHTPGEPTSPPILSMELSPSGMYVEVRFDDTPVYMTLPATSTVTLGWLERETHDV
jgi:hypothetical protein